MPTQGFPYLVITDGTNITTCADGTGAQQNWPLVQDTWQPNVARLRVSQMGGRGPWEDVAETLTMNIRGATATAALANLDSLVRLLEQAERLQRGETVNPVLIKYAPQGSTVASTSNPLQALILGRDPRAPDIVHLPPTFNKVGNYFEIDNVTVRFVRQGDWKLTEESHASSATTNGEIATASGFTALNTPGPTRFDFTNFGYFNLNFALSNGFHGGFLAVSDASNGIVLLDAEGLQDAGAFTAVSNTVSYARSSNVLRYTPTATTEADATPVPVTIPTTGQRFALLANVRNNSTTASFQLRASLLSRDIAYTPLINIPPQVAPYPHWVFMGIIPNVYDGNSRYINLYFTGSATTVSMDVDTLAIVNVTEPYTSILAIPEVDQTLKNILYVNKVSTASINHNLLTAVAPTFTANITSGAASPTYSQPWKGDPVFYTKGSSIYVCLMATGELQPTPVTTSSWRQASTGGGGGTVYQNTWTISRYSTYIDPQ